MSNYNGYSRRPQSRRRKKVRVRQWKRLALTIALVVALFVGIKLAISRPTRDAGQADPVSTQSTPQATPEVVSQPVVLPTMLPQSTELPASLPQATDNFAQELATAPPDSDDSWMLILANRWHSLPDGFAPPELTVLSNGESMDKRIYPELQQMFDDARAAGIYPFVRSGYRTHEEQQRTMDEKIAYYKEQGNNDADARELAETYVALPGTSEHETGLAVDINADTEKTEKDKVYSWLHDNSYKYGFILRYPDDKTDITGISYEPWHFRYVGETAATEIYERGICLEEYLGQVDS